MKLSSEDSALACCLFEISSGSTMKTALRVAALILTAVIGLWALGHGIALAVTVRVNPEDGSTMLRYLVEGSVFIAGGVSVLSLAIQQLYCWRTHRKGSGLLC
jgi:uncharacterized membrane protein HdeD (DUF308 family)